MVGSDSDTDRDAGEAATLDLRAAVRSLDLGPEVYEGLICLDVQGMDRPSLLAALKAKGVSKLGQRMRLATIMHNNAPSSTAPPLPPLPPSSASSTTIGSGRPPAATPSAKGKVWYEVGATASKVRCLPSLAAEVIDVKRQRQVLETDAEQDGWVRLTQPICRTEDEAVEHTVRTPTTRCSIRGGQGNDRQRAVREFRARGGPLRAP